MAATHSESESVAGEAVVKVSGESPLLYGEGRVEAPLVQPLTMDHYPDLAADIESILTIELPQHRLAKVEREGTEVKLCSALMGAYSRQGVGVCRHTHQRKYKGVLDACLRLASCRVGNLRTPFTSVVLNQGAY
eukprot:6487101-Amphidinium_carterae.2